MKTFEFKSEKQAFYIAEAYKTLRTNITFCGDDVKVISVTSCMPNDGKSELSWNVALNMAEAGKKVLLLDADLRKSVHVRRLGIKEDIMFGLSHFLSGQADINDVFYQSSFPNLYTIFAGSVPPNPAELLGNKRFEALLKVMRNSFDYIIIDTPPLGSVIDSAIVSSFCDGAILVISQGRISYKFAREVKAQLEKSNCRILGVILNKVDIREKGGYYKSYGYGKKYGYGYGKKYGYGYGYGYGYEYGSSSDQTKKSEKE